MQGRLYDNENGAPELLLFSLPESPGRDFGEDGLRAAVVHVTSKCFVYLRLIGLLHGMGSIKIFYEACIFLGSFDPTPGHGFPLRGLAITLFGHSTLGGTRLDD